MGDWSDYFEDFPEENPANYVGNRFDPKAAAAARADKAKVAQDQARLNAELRRIIEQHKQPKKP